MANSYLLIMVISFMLFNNQKEEEPDDPFEEKWSFFRWLMHGKKGNEGID